MKRYIVKYKGSDADGPIYGIFDLDKGRWTPVASRSRVQAEDDCDVMNKMGDE